MSEPTLGGYRATRGPDPALDLMAKATAALRADPGFVVREDDALAALFLADEAPQPLAARAFEQVLTRIGEADTLDREAAQHGGEDPLRAEIARLPSPVRETALEALDHDRWRFAGLGIRRLPLRVASPGRVELMRIEPGRGVASHAHGGDEVTLVLTGAYFDGYGHYGPGDISLAKGDFTHAPRADAGEVCYVLAVSYGPPRLGGIYGLLERLSR